MKTKGLFINNIKAKDSIYESGVMVFNCLKLSDTYDLDYLEININNRSVPLGYDFYFFNYHPATMPWLDTARLKKIPGLIITMLLDVLPDDPFIYCPDKHFHAYCVLDPTLKIKNKRVFPFPRPLEESGILKPYTNDGIPIIGSFGFATKGKGFHHVVDAVNKEFDKAIVKINIPFGDFVPNSESYAKYLGNVCKERAKDGIEVIVTHDFMSKSELIEWCSQNTLNCFLYDRNIPGLAATTDQAIVTGRPLSISLNNTFRHILSYLPDYPTWSLKESIEKSGLIVRQIKEDWSPENFCKLFITVLNNLLQQSAAMVQTGFVDLPVKKNNIQQLLARRFKKYFSMRKIKQLITFKNRFKYEELI